MRDEEIMQHRTDAKAHKLKAEIRKYRLREAVLNQTSSLEAELAAAKARMRQKREYSGRGDSSVGILFQRVLQKWPGKGRAKAASQDGGSLGACAVSSNGEFG